MESSEQPQDVTGEEQVPSSEPEAQPESQPEQQDTIPADPDPADAGPPADTPFDPSHSAAPTVPNEEGIPRQHGDQNPELGVSPSDGGETDTDVELQEEGGESEGGSEE